MEPPYSDYLELPCSPDVRAQACAADSLICRNNRSPPAFAGPDRANSSGITAYRGRTDV